MPLKIIGNYEEAYSRMLRQASQGAWKNDPIFRHMFFQYTEHSGPIRNVPGANPLDHPTARTTYKAEMSLDTLRNTCVDEHAEFVHDLLKAEEVAIGTKFFQTMLEVSDAIGNSIDARDVPLYDAFLDALEKLDITFNENGEANMPQLLMNPVTAETLKDTPPPTEEQTRRRKAIMDRKKEDFYAKKRTRRLS